MIDTQTATTKPHNLRLLMIVCTISEMLLLFTYAIRQKVVRNDLEFIVIAVIFSFVGSLSLILHYKKSNINLALHNIDSSLLDADITMARAKDRKISFWLKLINILFGAFNLIVFLLTLSLLLGPTDLNRNLTWLTVVVYLFLLTNAVVTIYMIIGGMIRFVRTE